eukprot:TRINITY_DN6307_c0_g1_i1.p1 TRINITY_DN6307_c0_g1~~TRINITY_DN6307_c0_g1_i1.p1  ORF type:complete len:155 (-),score=22.92 TRINITY_DN6307_c0_g1_i1:251-670(-)
MNSGNQCQARGIPTEIEHVNPGGKNELEHNNQGGTNTLAIRNLEGSNELANRNLCGSNAHERSLGRRHISYPLAFLITVGVCAHLCLLTNYNKTELGNVMDCIEAEFEIQMKKGEYNMKSVEKVFLLTKSWELANNIKT